MKAWCCGLLAMLLAALCMPPGCLAAEDQVFNGVDVKVFKTKAGEDLNTEAGFIRGILQPYYGPSYHVITPELSMKDLSAYPKARVTVVLPTATKLSLNATNKRVARFGMTVTSNFGPGNFSQIEIGVESDGTGWAPYFRTSIIRGLGLRTMPMPFGRLASLNGFSDTRTRSSRLLPAEARRVRITVNAVAPITRGPYWNGDRINAVLETLQWNGSAYVHLGFIKYTLPLGNVSTNTDPELSARPTFATPFAPFFARYAEPYAEGYALLRFGRFAALAPDNGKENAMADTADGSVLKLGRYIMQPLLMNVTTGKLGAWDEAHVEHAWAVQTANLAGVLDLGTATGDVFGGASKVWYGGRCISVKNTCSQSLAFETAFNGWTNFTQFKVAAYLNKIMYLARASAMQSDRGFTGLGAWVNTTSPGLTTNVVLPGDTSVPFCITCNGSCREHNLQTIYLRVPDATAYNRPPDSTDKTFCTNTDPTKTYSIAAKDDVTVWDNDGAVTWDKFYDAVSNRSAETCAGLSGDGLTFAEAAFVGFNYPTPLSAGSTDQSHLTVEVSCTANRKLLTFEPVSTRQGMAGNRRLLLV